MQCRREIVYVGQVQYHGRGRGIGSITGCMVYMCHGVGKSGETKIHSYIINPLVIHERPGPGLDVVGDVAVDVTEAVRAAVERKILEARLGAMTVDGPDPGGREGGCGTAATEQNPETLSKQPYRELRVGIWARRRDAVGCAGAARQKPVGAPRQKTGLVYVSAARADARIAFLQPQHLGAGILAAFPWKPLLLSSGFLPEEVLSHGPERIFLRANPGAVAGEKVQKVRLNVVLFM